MVAKNRWQLEKSKEVVVVYKIAAVVFLVEIAIMFLFELLPRLPVTITAIIDALVLSAAAGPIIYYFILKPRVYRLEATANIIFSNLIEGFVEQSVDGSIVDFNSAALEILGLSADQLRGRTSLDPRWRALRQDGSDFPGSEHPAMVALATGKTQKNVIMGLDLPDSSRKWIEINSIPQFKQNETKPFRALTTFNDITKQMVAEKKADKSRQILKGIEGSLIYSETDRDGHFLDVNQGFEVISGYKKEDLIGMSHRKVSSGIHPRAHYETLWSKILAGQTWFGEFCNRNRSGQLYWVQSIVSPVLGLDGKVEKILSISFDISEKKQAERALVQSAKMASLGQMAGGVAHEINNPLSIIMGKTNQIRSSLERGQLDPEKTTEALKKIEATVDRIAKIVRGLRAFSRNSDQDPMDKANITDILNDTIELCKERLRNQSIDLRTQINCSQSVECRPAQLGQVFMNLIGNAYDAIQSLPFPTDNITPQNKWISIDVLELAKGVEVSFTDCGLGISPDIIDRLMEPFFSTKRLGQGTGLGLSISKGIVEEHQGTLIYDEKSPNTRFVVFIPYRQNANQNLAS